MNPETTGVETAAETGPELIKPIVEAALFAAGRPLDLDQLSGLFVSAEPDSAEADAQRKAARKNIRAALRQLQGEADGRGVELIEVASGWRYQVKPLYAEQVGHLWANRPSRYSRALLETLAIIAYRQPITRREIESIRGVSVSTQIMQTLLEYNWVRILGHRNTPGRPMLYGSTSAFLDHFGLKSLEQLPPLAELQDLAKIDAALLRNSPDLDLFSAAADTSNATLPLEADPAVAGEVEGVVEGVADTGADAEAAPQKKSGMVFTPLDEEPAHLSENLETLLTKAVEFANQTNSRFKTEFNAEPKSSPAAEPEVETPTETPTAPEAD